MLRILGVVLLATVVLAQHNWDAQSQRSPKTDLRDQTYQNNHNANAQLRHDHPGCPEQVNQQHQPVVHDIPNEYLQAHHQFTGDFLKDPAFWKNINEHGVAATNTFTVGHLLAVLSQKTFDVPVQVIPQILHLNTPEKIAESYAKQFQIYEYEDNHVYPSSHLWTPQEQLQISPAVQRLHTRKQNLNLVKNQYASAYINEVVHAATQDDIDNQLVPQVPPFTDNTVGVFVNTFHYNADWKFDLTQLGKKSFNTYKGVVPLETYETRGNFPVYETATFTAVAIPFEGHSKHAVFVLPKNDVQEYLSQGHVDQIFVNGPKYWPVKNVRVQVPRVNFTAGHDINQLRDDKLECVEDGQQAHLLQRIVQIVAFTLTTDYVEYSVATGVQVDAQNRNTRYQANRVNNANTPYNAQTPTRSPSNQPLGVNVRHNANEIVFDRPFFLYLNDEHLGPFAFQALAGNFVYEESPRQARHHDHPLDFTESTKVHRWNCH